jgi:glycogen operon protein
MAQRIAGSPDLYAHRGPAASVNFITCHDGFTLADLVSYNYKHNEANGERGRDGSDENHSWNCGVEGPTDDPAVAALRLRQMKNALAMLFLSQGVPMLLMGDEMARTQRGNNNAYCQDNEISWLDWRLQTAQAELRRFCRRLIAFRQAHRCLRAPHFAASPAAPDSPLQITWHGVRPEQPDWSEGSRVLAFEKRLYDAQGNDVVYAALNMYWEPLAFLLPPPPAGAAWRLFANTAAPPPADVADANDPGKLADPQQVVLGGRSIVVLYAG